MTNEEYAALRPGTLVKAPASNPGNYSNWTAGHMYTLVQLNEEDRIEFYEKGEDYWKNRIKHTEPLGIYYPSGALMWLCFQTESMLDFSVIENKDVEALMLT